MEKILYDLKIKTKPAEEQVPVLAAEVERLNSELEKKSTELSTASESLDTAKSDLSKKQEELDKANAKIKELEEDKTKLQEANDTLSSTLETANHKIAELDDVVEKSAIKPTMKIGKDLCYINVKVVRHKGKEYTVEEIKELPEIAKEIYEKGGQTFTKVTD